MNDHLLDRLADVEVGTRTPDLASVERRSRAILRRHRTMRAGAIGLALVATLAAGTILPLGSQSGAPLAETQAPLPFGALPASASADDAACNVGFGSQIERDTWSDDSVIVRSAALISDPPIALTHVEVHLDEGNCPDAVPAAVLYDADPVRGISVWPDVQDPFASTEGVDDSYADAPLDHVVVGGHDALMRDSGDQSIQLSWLTADGTRWMAMSSGFPAAEALAVLDGLSFSGFTLDASSVPAGLTVAPVSTVAPTTSVKMWSAYYGEEDGQPAADPPVTVLSATTVFRAPPEVAASMHAPSTAFAEVNGVPAVFSTNGADLAFATFGWLKWTQNGVSYSLVGTGSFDELVALAEKVEPVSLDDSRVIGAPGPEDAPGR
ncbi:hypothetical protein [Sanguibacter sp. 25GB23B1]|uniref:hypothetical protein n=1 Tax=unclassified Sanguibacter TaxID=2645534 RepID=UPI0032AFFA8E